MNKFKNYLNIFYTLSASLILGLLFQNCGQLNSLKGNLDGVFESSSNYPTEFIPGTYAVNRPADQPDTVVTIGSQGLVCSRAQAYFEGSVDLTFEVEYIDYNNGTQGVRVGDEELTPLGEYLASSGNGAIFNYIYRHVNSDRKVASCDQVNGALPSPFEGPASGVYSFDLSATYNNGVANDDFRSLYAVNDSGEFCKIPADKVDTVLVDVVILPPFPAMPEINRYFGNNIEAAAYNSPSKMVGDCSQIGLGNGVLFGGEYSGSEQPTEAAPVEEPETPVNPTPVVENPAPAVPVTPPVVPSEPAPVVPSEPAPTVPVAVDPNSVRQLTPNRKYTFAGTTYYVYKSTGENCVYPPDEPVGEGINQATFDQLLSSRILRQCRPFSEGGSGPAPAADGEASITLTPDRKYSYMGTVYYVYKSNGENCVYPNDEPINDSVQEVTQAAHQILVTKTIRACR